MKRVCAILLIFCLLMMIFPAGIYKSEAAVAFKDVPSDAWYYSHVKYVTEDPRQLMPATSARWITSLWNSSSR